MRVELKKKGGTVHVPVLVIAVVMLLCISIGAFASIWRNKSAQAFGGAQLDGDLGASIDLAATSAQYTLPDSQDPYQICVWGNRAYIICGANPTATTSAGGYTFSLENACIGPMRINGAKCAHIASSANGQVEFLHFDVSLN